MSIDHAQVKPAGAPDRVPWRSFAGIYLVVFLIGTETFLVSPLLPTIAESIQVSETAAAITVTAYTLVYAITAPFLGAVSDRFGRQPTIVAGAVLFLLGNVLAALAGNLEVLILARVIGALGAGLAGPSIWAHIAESVPERLVGRAIGVGLALFSAGQVLGIPIAGLVADVSGWRVAFWVIAAASVITVPLVYRETRGSKPRGATLNLGSVFSVWSDTLLRQALIVVLFLQAANLGAYTFLGVVLHDRFGLSVGELGLIGVLVGIGGAVGALLAGRIGDKTRANGRQDTFWIPIWSVLLGVAAVVAAFGAPLVVAAAAIVIWFVASGAFGSNVQTLLLNLRPALGATSSSWNSAVLYAGAAGGVALVGLFPHVDVGVAVVGGGLALIAAVLSLPLLTAVTRQAAASSEAPGRATGEVDHGYV
ncbi:MFS transporter [Micromonospora arborensis]|uniref:MFS transporter n=1 Tax=Micromonospora arborensis TaxID=2116518 RepID=UPI00142DAE38|nr:MFS transporter [Micromonospora arborensis]